jgi:hypothetical protein
MVKMVELLESNYLKLLLIAAVLSIIAFFVSHDSPAKQHRAETDMSSRR